MRGYTSNVRGFKNGRLPGLDRPVVLLVWHAPWLIADVGVDAVGILVVVEGLISPETIIAVTREGGGACSK
jgi:hypothetical protein